MAVLSSDKKYVTVEKGDTLSEIAEKYLGSASKYKTLAAINDISDPDLIYVGQKIYLSKTTSSSTTAKKKTSSKVAKITHFGLQSNSDGTLFAAWSWNAKNTKEYSYQWHYATGDGVAFVGAKGTTTDKRSTYTIPSNATKVRFRVKPISKTYTKNKKETKYWTAEWTAWKYFYAKSIPPDAPGTPSVTIDEFKLTAELDNIEVDATKIEFQVVKNDKSVFKTGTSTIKTKHASFSCTVDAGGEYKVRCRAIRDKLKSDWSTYSNNEGTIPAASKGISKIKALSDTAVFLDWHNVSNAKNYVIEYTTQKRYFDSSNEVNSMTVDAGVVGHAEVTGLASGDEYFFRVKATNDKGSSAWTAIRSIILGKVPAAPTTWSSTTTVVTGEPLNLYWTHNTEDGSSQTFAQLKITIGSDTKTHMINTNEKYTSGIVSYSPPSDLEEGEVVTSMCSINTAGYAEGTKIKWYVRTAGITEKYGDWSTVRTVTVYAPPTLELSAIYKNGDAVDVLESFPFYISGTAGPSTQKPVGYHLSVISEETYTTVDGLGEEKIVNKGDAVYSKYFDTSKALNVAMSASNINLDNGITYTIKCTVTMNSGLTATATIENFDVSWTDPEYEPNADIAIDENDLSAYIRPYCRDITITYYQVSQSSGKYVKTTTEITDGLYGVELKDTFTTTGEQVYLGVTDEDVELYYCEVLTETIISDVKLAVYRREFDGTFTEIGSGLKNYTTVVDPHPSLDYARYRIVATDNTTGGISYFDLPGEPVGEHAVVIQWDEKWSSFDVTNEDELEQPAWAGSMLKLPYNIDVADKCDVDVSHINYIGRRNPVSYYGTHIGETATWNVVIPKEDKDTIYALRRLAVWMGDVYVREPSGTGYWATVSISMPQKHLDLTIPVTIDITRVEGGM